MNLHPSIKACGIQLKRREIKAALLRISIMTFHTMRLDESLERVFLSPGQDREGNERDKDRTRKSHV